MDFMTGFPVPMGNLRLSFLLSSFLFRILSLIFTISEHLPLYSAHFNEEV